MNDHFRPGQIIFFARDHLALIIKPENGEDIWQAGLFVKYLNDLNDTCIITDMFGKSIKCPSYMIQRLS